MKGDDHVGISDKQLDIQALTALVASEKAGAISTFLGVTRDHHGGKQVCTLLNIFNMPLNRSFTDSYPY